MWYYVKWGFGLLALALLGAFLHYTLPQYDTARITDTYTKRVDFGENWLFYSHAGAGDAEGVTNRDVFFIATILASGKPMEYRNEDTGWSWPPYFKFNTSNLQTRAADLRSTADNPQWVSIRHYGWRSNLFSIYPNAVAIQAVDGPDHQVINWFNIVFLIVFGGLAWALVVRWRRFRARRIDPTLEKWGDQIEAAGDDIAESGGRLRRWWRSLFN